MSTDTKRKPTLSAPMGNLSDAVYMPLNGRAVSNQALALVADVASRIRDRPSRPFRDAVAAILCDVLRIGRYDAAKWGQRSMQSNALTSAIGSSRVIPQIMDGLAEQGLVDHVPGYRAFGPNHFGARAACFRASKALRDLAATHGVDAKHWRDHFEVPPDIFLSAEDPLELRTARRWVCGRSRDPISMPIDAGDATADAIRQRVRRLNEYIAGHTITPYGFAGYTRIFGKGDEPGFAWRSGGRLYYRGDGDQTAPKDERSGMLIDGAAVVEVDIQASNLTILHGMRGLPMDPDRDPYEVEGIPRSVVKAWVTMTLGHTRFHSRWPTEIRRRQSEKLGCDLSAAYPIGKISTRILAALPILADWPRSEVTWADLQFAESEVVMATMEALAFEHDVPCLSVHDSIIVPASRAALARGILEETFEAIVGIRPVVP